jgi:hypothetical protein
VGIRSALASGGRPGTLFVGINGVMAGLEGSSCAIPALSLQRRKAHGEVRRRQASGAAACARELPEGAIAEHP